MQIVLNMVLEEPCILPLSYHHIVQSAIYELTSENDENECREHKGGVHYNTRVYRSFTFGLLDGKYSIINKQISFKEMLSMEIRSMDEHIVQLIMDNAIKNGIRLGKNLIPNIKVERQDYKVLDNDIVISMNSPICVYETDPESKHTHFYTPDETVFYKAISNNFTRKYTAFFGQVPESEITLERVQVKARDKYVTKYKGFILSGWKGIYRLIGKPEYLDFLYQTGLGAKNAQGFGMFDVVR